MVIKISQAASNIKQSYDIESDGFYYSAKAGSFSRLQDITMTSQTDTIKGTYRIPNLVNFIPLRHIFGKANLTRVFNLYRNDDHYGTFVYSKHGLFKSCYIITLTGGEIFYCYCRSIGSFDYVSIYHNDVQIALVETYLSVNDYKYVHKLYILDDFDNYANTLSFYVIYYASYAFAQRMHMSSGSVSAKSWSFSRYNNKYDPKWRETHFPDENFFGRIL